MSRDAVVCEPLRTPVGRFGGIFRDVPAAALASTVVAELVKRTGLRGEHVDALLIGADLVEIAEDFAVLRALAGIHNADDFPIAAAEGDALAEASAGVTLRDGLADDHFALTRLKPAPTGDLEAMAHFDADRRKPAQSHVHAFRRVHAGQVDHRHDF